MVREGLAAEFQMMRSSKRSVFSAENTQWNSSKALTALRHKPGEHEEQKIKLEVRGASHKMCLCVQMCRILKGLSFFARCFGVDVNVRE